ncbi:site-specific integrase [Tessaracoccus sp. MC1756]|uniref:tyrosine-type recombinase/integrase n=1 Tax=Tessaracoccus sp. MC1756 TaxID=2760311 RepID=UPI0015FF0668|nr:site-specific integrase [Tessaracoccus sp. MC1756]MBB1510668.1 site-specific integrase [Tessaracoccus sp. MC1756]
MAGKRGNGEDSIYKSDGRWYVQGYIEEGSGPIRRKVSAKTKGEAVRKWQERKSEAALGARRLGQPKNVAALLQHWMDLRSPDLKYKTRIGYEGSISRHLVPYFGTRKVTAVRVADVERWQHELGTVQGLSRSTIHQARTILSQAFDMAIRHGDLLANSVRLAHHLKKDSARIQALTEGQAQQLMRSLAPEDVQARVRLLLALTLGLRQGEFLALQWRDVELDAPNPHLVVRASLQRQTGKGLVRSTPKTVRSHRTLHLAQPLVDALRALRLEQKEILLRSGGTYNPDGYVLVSSAGTPIDAANDRKHWYKLLEVAGLPPVRVHAARHTAATLLLQEVGMHIVQQVMGHTDIRTTVDIYGHLTPADGALGITNVAARLTA